MSIELLLAALRAHRPFDDVERVMLEQVIGFIDMYPHKCCDRTLQVGHLTGSAWILDESKQRVLLMHHRKLGKWLQLGGHADGDTDLLRVALREAYEESGLREIEVLSSRLFDVDVHTIPARESEPAHQHYDIRFLFSGNSREALHVNHESNRLEWVSISELEEREASNESLSRLIRKTKILPALAK